MDIYDQVTSEDIDYSEIGQSLPDPFYDSIENHVLIGVANIFLTPLFHNIKFRQRQSRNFNLYFLRGIIFCNYFDEFVFSYNTPIVAQDGTVSGKLMVELVRTAGEMSLPQEEEEEEESWSESSGEESESASQPPGQLSFRLRLLSVSGLPPALAHFVFCQFSVWPSDQPHLVPSRPKSSNKTTDFVFNYSKDFSMEVTEELQRFCAEKSLSVSVFGHKSKGFFSLREALQDRRRAQVITTNSSLPSAPSV